METVRGAQSSKPLIRPPEQSFELGSLIRPVKKSRHPLRHLIDDRPKTAQVFTLSVGASRPFLKMPNHEQVRSLHGHQRVRVWSPKRPKLHLTLCVSFLPM